MLCSSHTSTPVCKDTHPCQTPGRKQPLSSMQGDGGEGSYISHLDFLRIQTWMAWPVRKAPVLMSRTHVLPQVVMHLFPLFPLEQRKSIRNTSLMGLSAPRHEREGKSWICECSNGIFRKLQTTKKRGVQHLTPPTAFLLMDNLGSLVQGPLSKTRPSTN